MTTICMNAVILSEGEAGVEESIYLGLRIVSLGFFLLNRPIRYIIRVI